MKRSIHFFLKYYLFWFLFFVAFKLLFMVCNVKATLQMGIYDFFMAFFRGAKMDLSAAGYLSVLPGVFLAFSSVIKPETIVRIIRGYTLFFVIIVSIMGIADISLYPYWRTRLNAQVLPFLSEPVGLFSSISFWNFAFFIIALFIIAGGVYVSYRKLFPNNLLSGSKIRWYVSPVILLLTGALLLPIRGGLNTSPLNFSSVYFSKNLYSNQCAYNFFWSFNHAITHNKLKNNPFTYFLAEECKKNIEKVPEPKPEELPMFVKGEKPVNVILIILESFSNKVIESLGGVKGLTPNLDSLGKEGILFTSFYATGNRSDKGISSLIASYPALCRASSIIGYPDKMKDLDFLPQYFKRNGYNFSFYYGGDVNFYNTRMVMIQAGADQIISSSDFPEEIASLQKWGVPDEYLYQKMYNDLINTKQPFFNILYTISSHDPYDIPGYVKVKENNGLNYFNSVCYADSCLGVFVNNLMNSQLWDNTMLIVTSDHATPDPGPTMYNDPATYRIPMIWTGGAIDTTFVCNAVAMQTDLSTTLLQQLGWEAEKSYFSKNIFGDKQYAFFFRDEGWGFLSPETGFFTDKESGMQQFFYGEECDKTDSLQRFAKSFTQYLHNDFLKR